MLKKGQPLFWDVTIFNEGKVIIGGLLYKNTQDVVENSVVYRKRNANHSAMLYNTIKCILKGDEAVTNLLSSLLANSPGMIFFINILDILIIAFAIYKILELMQGTRAMLLVKGIAILLIFSVVSEAIGLSTVNWVLVQLQKVFIIAIPIVFAPELRRGLEQLGTGYFLLPNRRSSDNDIVSNQVTEIVNCMISASATRTGVLMAITRENGLKEYVSTGIAIHGDLSTALLKNIFIVNTPLHDGAVIITNNEIVAASCFLPLSDNTNISMKLGTRHRAAIGLSEVSDAVVAVVSEETGAMSIAEHGHLRYDLSREDLIHTMTDMLKVPEEASLKQRIKKVFHR